MVVAIPQRILTWEPESTEAFKHFSTINWFRQLLSTPGLNLFRTDYVRRKALGWDPVVSGVLARADVAGVRHFLSALAYPGILTSLDHPRSEAAYYGSRRPASSAAMANPPLSAWPFYPDLPDHGNPFPQHVNFYTVGADLAGVPNTVHGGITALLIDSAFAQLGFVHADPKSQFYSAFTNVRYFHPLALQKPQQPQPQQQQQQQQQQQGHRQIEEDRPSSSSSETTKVGDDEDEDETKSRNRVVNFVVRAQVDSRMTKQGDNKMYVLAQVETDGGKVCAIGEGLVVEKLWPTSNL